MSAASERGTGNRGVAPEVRIDGRTLGPRDLGGARPKQVLEILLAARGHRVSTDRPARAIATEKGWLREGS